MTGRAPDRIEIVTRCPVKPDNDIVAPVALKDDSSLAPAKGYGNGVADVLKVNP
jgi:hypothetical protein